MGNIGFVSLNVDNIIDLHKTEKKCLNIEEKNAISNISSWFLPSWVLILKFRFNGNFNPI